MSPKLEQLAKRNTAIYNDYLEMWGKKNLRFDVINKRLGRKYFLTPLTIARTITKMSKVIR